MAKTNTATASAPAKAPAEMGLSFEDAAVPAVTREPKVNPFSGVAKLLADNRETAKAFVVSNDDVAYNVRLAQNAGKEHNVTIRNKREDIGGGKTRITVWAVDAIKRPRNGK